MVDGVHRWVLAGDESALPAIARRLRELPPGAAGVAFIEIADIGERLDLPAPPGVVQVWLTRDGRPPGGDLLPDAVRGLPEFTEGTFVWAGAEAGVARSTSLHSATVEGDSFLIALNEPNVNTPVSSCRAAAAASGHSSIG